jgi:hypothetical protein
MCPVCLFSCEERRLILDAIWKSLVACQISHPIELDKMNPTAIIEQMKANSASPAEAGSTMQPATEALILRIIKRCQVPEPTQGVVTDVEKCCAIHHRLGNSPTMTIATSTRTEAPKVPNTNVAEALKTVELQHLSAHDWPNAKLLLALEAAPLGLNVD